MDSRNRILSAMHLEQPDRVPMSPFITTGWINAAGEKVFEEFLEETDLILVLTLSSHIMMGEKAVAITEAMREGNEITTIIHTPAGNLVSVAVEETQYSWVREFPFKNADDIEKFYSIPYEPPAVDVELWRHWDERIGERGLVLADIPSAIYFPGSWFSPEDFMMHYMDNPNMIIDLMNTAQERILIFVEKCLEQGIKHFRIVGPELAVPPLMGPDSFRRLVVPYDREVAKLIRSAGGTVHVHSHGRVGELLEEFASIGCHSLDPLEAPPSGDVCLADAKKRIGDRVCLVGNLDDMAVISSVPLNELEKLCKSCIDKAAPGGGYILAGTSTGLYTPKLAERWLFMAKVAREYGSYS
ncbi:MAG: hypothetical protein GX855_03760 [Firmicutes bacterium]|nr:hypothetical protein [Bacillota bacterium]